MQNKVMRLIFALGIALALFGVGIDYLLPGASPGLNLPQLLIIAAGLALSAGAWRLRRPQVWQRLSGNKSALIAKALMITLLTLFALEIVLTVWGMPTYFPSEPPEMVVEIDSWRTCDHLGCRYDYESAMETCAAGLIQDRHCIVNRQGFADSDEFVAADFANRMRVMTLGDSFTQGFSADVGYSFVETIETLLPDIILWNTAIHGSGTTQAIATFQEYAPVLQPQLTILGFYMNDFRDNVAPLDGWLSLMDSEGVQYFVRRFQFDRWGNPVELPADEVNAYLAMGYKPPLTELERAVGLTRLGTLLLRLLDMLGSDQVNDSIDNQLRLTRQFLTQLRDAAAELDSALLVLLIPRSEYFTDPVDLYSLAIELAEELKIPT